MHVHSKICCHRDTSWKFHVWKNRWNVLTFFSPVWIFILSPFSSVIVNDVLHRLQNSTGTIYNALVPLIKVHSKLLTWVCQIYCCKNAFLLTHHMVYYIQVWIISTYWDRQFNQIILWLWHSATRFDLNLLCMADELFIVILP